MNKFFKSGIAIVLLMVAAMSSYVFATVFVNLPRADKERVEKKVKTVAQPQQETAPRAEEQAAPQQAPSAIPGMEALPVDEAVRVGVLPNGLTYYIRHNENPKGQADFYIAQKVGSILEEDNQRGLAHFLEHMCFNGTENFPGKDLINWLESVGVKFGQNLNAYTSVDETVYNISSVPVARQSVQDSCLLILHDWSNALTLDPAEIDAERGVIHEEWRRSMVGQMRILEELLPTVYQGDKYGYRLPIGTMDVVDNFPPQALVDYYHTWYRPDQQAIIVVGDINPDYIEGKIKELFTPIKMPENAPERYYVDVEDNDGTIYAIGKDPEMGNAISLMMFKTDNMLPREMRNTQIFFPVKYMTDVVSMMLNNRLLELAKKPDAPFAMASVNIGNFFLAPTKDALMLQVVAKDGDLTSATAAAYRELQRAIQGGFTQGEFERANAEIRSSYQRQYDSRNNTPNESYSREYVRSFIDNSPIPGIEFEKQTMDLLTQMMPVNNVNSLLPQLVQEDNRVVLMMLPDAEGFIFPDEASVAAALAAVDEEELEPYKDEMRTDPMIPNLPAPGKIVSEQHVDKWDATEYTLGNGVKVVVKPTTFKDNEITFMAIAKGGVASLPDEYAPSIIFSKYSLSNAGYGDYSNSDVKKYLQGKQVNIQVDLSPYDRSVVGNTTINDLPTLMELIYATFTETNFKADEFTAMQNILKGALANQESTPEFIFGKMVMDELYDAPAKAMITSAIIDQANIEQTDYIVDTMLADAADFTFFFVGSIDLETLKPLIEQYIATLPTGGSKVTYAVNPGFEPKLNGKTITNKMAMSTPQTWAYLSLGASENYDHQKKVMTSMLAQILSKRLLNKVREEMGATYSIHASGDIARTGDVNVEIEIPFPMKPELQNEVLDAINAIFAEMGTSITDEDLNPVKEFMVKNAVQSLEENYPWLTSMSGEVLNGVDTFNGRVDVVNAITTEDLQNYWKEIMGQGKTTVILLEPTE